MGDFGDRIIPIAIGLASPSGVWLSLRHRLGRDLAIVLDGRKVVSGEADYEVIKKAIECELQRSEVGLASQQRR